MCYIKWICPEIKAESEDKEWQTEKR
jgi:hypothetical protein